MKLSPGQFVLIFTNFPDTHTDLVSRKINDIGYSYKRVNIDTFSNEYDVSFFVNDESLVSDPSNFFSDIDNSNILSVWLRRPFEFRIEANNINEKFKRQELEGFMRSVILNFSNASLVVDPLDKLSRAKIKIQQLLTAHKLGLSIPKTLITNSIRDAKRFFYDSKKGVITKPINLGHALITGDIMAVYTTEVTKEMNFDLVRNCPTLFQEKIKKKSDIRITIIGRKIFAVEIDSQAYLNSQIDSRRVAENLFNIKHSSMTLPNSIEKKLFQLMDYYGLHYGAIDMALTPEGEYVFFELNPAGQFLWLEPLTGIPLAEEMAKFLVGIEPPRKMEKITL